MQRCSAVCLVTGDHYDLHVLPVSRLSLVYSMLGEQQRTAEIERQCLLRTLRAIPVARLSKLAEEIARGRLIELVLQAGDMDLFAAMVQQWWHDCPASNETVQRVTATACRQGNLSAIRLLEAANKFDLYGYCRHVTEELTRQRIELTQNGSPDYYDDEEECDARELAADLVRLRRFDLLRSLTGAITSWPLLLLRLLLSGHWIPEVAELFRQRRPDELGLTVDGTAKVLQELTSRDRLSSELPADWQSWMPPSPPLISRAAFALAGASGNVEVVRELIAMGHLPSIGPDEVACCQLAVATLPEVAAKLDNGWRKWPATAASCLPVLKHHLAQRGVARLRKPPLLPAEVASLAAHVDRGDLRDYLNEASCGLTLELEPLAAIIANYSERPGALSLADRWLWRASLRDLLPRKAKRHAEWLLHGILAGQASSLLGETTAFESMFVQ